MYTKITRSSFIDAFLQSNTYKDNFSYEGLDSLFDYLEDLEEQCDTPIEFDMIALCCDYSEYESIKEAYMQYKSEEDYNDFCEYKPWDNADIVKEIRDESALEYLEDRTTVIKVEGTDKIIIQDF